MELALCLCLTLTAKKLVFSRSALKCPQYLSSPKSHRLFKGVPADITELMLLPAQKLRFHVCEMGIRTEEELWVKQKRRSVQNPTSQAPIS